jgi:hypothetical protein
VRESAARALVGRSAPPVLEALFGCLARGGPEGAVALEVLATAPAATVEPRLTALLAGSPFTAADYHAPGEPTAARAHEMDRTYESAMNVLRLLARRPDPARVPRLWELFCTPPAGQLQPVLGEVLGVIGGPFVEEHAQHIQFAMIGMGLALNQDHARRAQLLGLDPDDDSGGIVKFEPIDLDTVRTLVAERFTTVEMAQNDAPNTAQLMAFMEQWPEVKAHGYAVVPSRPDYRVTLEGLHCDLDEVAADRREPLREAFAEMCAEANEVETEGDVLSSWWT